MSNPEHPNIRRATWVVVVLALVLVAALPRLTNLNGYLIVDEADRWHWAESFYRALISGDPHATLVGDGYPGIFPAWLETAWLLGESARRSILEGKWFGDDGVYMLFHVWSRTEHLAEQRLPIALFNTLVALLIGWFAARIYGRRVGLVAAVFVALDPFCLGDSRVNRAEAIISGLLVLSVLSLVRYGQTRRLRWVVLSGLMGGLGFLTKIQGLVLLPAVGIIALLVESQHISWPQIAPHVKSRANRSLTPDWQSGPTTPPAPDSQSGATTSLAADWQSGATTSLAPDLQSGAGSGPQIHRDHEGRLPGDSARRNVARWLLAALAVLGLWLAVAIMVWIILWPAMWVRPLDVLSLVYEYATRKIGSEGVNLFFLGQHFYGEDPGPLFYPMVVLLRTTPLTLIGLALAVWAGIRALKSRPGQEPPVQPRGTWALLGAMEPVVPLVVYVVLYWLAMSLGSHKQDRYLMPIFPALDILAAMGWVSLWAWLSGRRKRLASARWTQVAFGGLLATQMALVLPFHPYYLPYFNQMLGGGAVGVRALRVGWGEGMDRVAAYLNTKPNAADLTVAARWNRYMLDFAGKTLPFDELGQWARADYMVLYVQQTQRMLDPSPGVLRYFLGRQPERVVTLGGIDYAQIYPSPFTRWADPTVSRLPGRAALFGYRWEGTDVSGPQVRAIWENQDSPSQPLRVVAALTDGEAQSDWQDCAVAPGYEEAARTPGEIVESACDLSAMAESLPAGTYDIRFGVSNQDGQVDGILFSQGWRCAVKDAAGSWRPATWIESLDEIARRALPPGATPTDIYYEGSVRLAGFELSSTTLQAGQPLGVTLYWQAVTPIKEDLIVFNHLFGLDGTNVGEADGPPPIPTTEWLPAQVITTSRAIQTDAALAVPSVSSLDVGLYRPGGDRRALTTTDRQAQQVPPTVAYVKFVPAVWPDQPPPVVSNALFDGRLLLRGHSPIPESINSRETDTLNLQLWWEVVEPVSADYAAFVHVVDMAYSIVAQADGVPLAGRYPTSAWDVGEHIVETRTIVLPADLPLGRYQLVLGLYNPLDGGRLSLAGGQGDSVLLGEIHVE